MFPKNTVACDSSPSLRPCLQMKETLLIEVAPDSIYLFQRTFWMIPNLCVGFSQGASRPPPDHPVAAHGPPETWHCSTSSRWLPASSARRACFGSATPAAGVASAALVCGPLLRRPRVPRSSPARFCEHARVCSSTSVMMWLGCRPTPG